MKLVRDKIPRADEAHGTELYFALRAKLLEEAGEVTTAATAETLREELADCVEVLMAIAKEAGLLWEDVEGRRVHKLELSGGFEDGGLR